MRDVSEQLADYFDATVERITAEDVLAGREVASPTLQLQPNSTQRLRPVWALAVAFVTTIVVIGGSVGIGSLLRAELIPMGAGSGTAVPPTGSGTEAAWPWILVSGLALVLLAAVVVVVAKRRMSKVRTNRGMTMTMTTEQPAVDERVQRIQTTNRVLVVAVVVLAVLGIGLGGWAIYQATTTEPAVTVDNAGTVPDDVASLIDDWWAANDRGDGSVVELYRIGGYHMFGGKRIAREDIADHLAQPGWTSEWISEPYLVVDEGDGRYVVVGGLRNSNVSSSSASAIVFEIKTDSDGQLQFAQTAWVYKN